MLDLFVIITDHSGKQLFCLNSNNCNMFYSGTNHQLSPIKEICFLDDFSARFWLHPSGSLDIQTCTAPAVI
ncbi:unnamed protein product [Rhizophagus irregularis]|nr:unnamed protein product [Rhizophagus irregularis]